MTGRRKKALAGTALVCLGLWQIFEGGWIHAKAALAGQLISIAWTRTLASGHSTRPWPWADTWPVARLQFPSLGKTMPVLAGASGATLAFGAGHLDGTARPGRPGTSVIAGHRDTSFRFLGSLRTGDPVSVQRPDGTWRRYRVTGTAIADARRPWPVPPINTGRTALAIVTCWPLDSIIPGGPLRYLIYAEESPAR